MYRSHSHLYRITTRVGPNRQNPNDWQEDASNRSPTAPTATHSSNRPNRPTATQPPPNRHLTTRPPRLEGDWAGWTAARPVGR